MELFIFDSGTTDNRSVTFRQFYDKVNLAWIIQVLEEYSFYALWLVHRVLEVDLPLTSSLYYQFYFAHTDFAERS